MVKLSGAAPTRASMSGRIGFIVAVLLGWAAGPAAAVEIINKDKAPRTVTIIAPEGRKTVTVPAGGTVANVCNACTIDNGSGGKRDVSGAQRVTISGPLLLVSGQP
ncbi:MAG: hypothetical protein SFV19_10995 [Rhodospirillaceae bacterium]|nr:hypothetical protein [Rhodospirillaceae bacterium]